MRPQTSGARRNFGARIKEFTVNEVQSCHAKNRQALSLRPFWRVTVSVNEEPENLLILPPLDDSLVDKLLLLKANKQTPVMPTGSQQERQGFWKTLIDELPGFLWHVGQWQIPTDMKSDRFGIAHFHHPELLQAIEESTPEAKLLALIDTAFAGGPLDKENGFLGTAEQLEFTLSGHFQFETRRLFTWANAGGTYLGRLADKHPTRVKERRTGTQRRWQIAPALKPMTA